MRTHRIGLVHVTSLCTVLLPALAAAGCLATPSPDEVTAAELACPADEPDCDRLEQPCVFDDEEASPMGPGSSPTGLTEDKTAAGKYRVWPKGRVPYKIDSSVGATTKGLLLQAMNEWEQKTSGSVRFEKATSADGTYMVVSGGSPITSHVGYRAGIVTKVKLRNPEYVTVIRHELGHVLGLHHEQRRSDRSGYIQVKTGNIVDSAHCKFQFSVCADCELIKGYDVDSVMQYRTSDLGNCRTGPVLLHKDGSAINHTWLIRSGDVAAIHVLYGPPPVSGAGGTGGAGGSGGSGGSGSGGTTSGTDAGADAAPGSGSGGAAGGTAGAGGAAGSTAAMGGAAGDDSIDSPDEETGGTNGGAGAPTTGGSSPGTGTGASAGTAPAEGSSESADDSGCSTSGAPGGRDWTLLGLALACVGLARRRRAAQR